MGIGSAVIIGGGVIGLSTAYQLALKGFSRIAVLDKGKLGEGASGRAAGIGTQLQPSEVGVRSRVVSFQMFRQFSEEWDDYTFHNRHGCLNLFRPEAWTSRSELLPLYRRLQVPFEVLDAKEMKYRWPAMNPSEELCGLFDPHGGYSEPDEYIAALTRRVRQLGVKIFEGEPVVEFLRDRDCVTGVRTTRQTIEADAIISTVHIWSLPLWRELNLRLPMKHFVHQRYVTAPLEQPLIAPAINADPYLGYVRPAVGNRILMGVETTHREEFRVESTEFEMRSLTTSVDIRDDCHKRLSELTPALQDVTWESETIGLISFASDGEPILGPVTAIPGLYVAASFHSGGFSYNPIAGLLTAELIADGRTKLDINAFSPDRFQPAETQMHLAQTLLQCQAVRRRH